MIKAAIGTALLVLEEPSRETCPRRELLRK